MNLVITLSIILLFLYLVKKFKKKNMQPISGNTHMKFKLLAGRKSNEYYTFPIYEDAFKIEAFEDRGIIVQIIHSDGYVEHLTRKVHKIWETTVLWNIETMYSDYTGTKLNKIDDIKVYACPLRYKEIIPSCEQTQIK